ncbi:hypothetical protein [Streptomyces naphthomycinicus]|uniref:hypothetical protein n=1 Tax=Streptomyces naphthomycinicus TaxID=2872625 RepID=UPI001CED4258|nr:hypothetical protein [Streptomyces sp. TML10]
MTKFLATVCLPPTPPDRVADAIAVAMAPYDINATDDWNPVGEWDAWFVHVHPESPFVVRPEHDGDRRILTAATDDGLDPLGPLECYGGPRGLLDFAAMRRRAVRGHDALLAAWEHLAAVHPPARPLTEFAARHEADPDGYPLARAKEDHLAQPLVQEVARRAVAGDPHFGMSFLTTDPVAYFAGEHAALRESVLRAAVPGYALLGLDGRWRDAGTEGYWEWADDHLERLDPETVVVDVLCHC